MAFFRRVFISTITGINQPRVTQLVKANLDLMAKMESEDRTALTFAEMRSIIYSIYSNRREPAKKVQLFHSVKKGSGSTTLCHNVAAMTALFGFKVLVVDCDPQADITKLLSFKQPNDRKTLFDVIDSGAEVDSVIYPVYEGLDLIPADVSMVKLDSILARRDEGVDIVSKIIDSLKARYDFIFMDASPVLNAFNKSLSFNSDVVNIVTELNHSGLKAVNILAQEVENFGNILGRGIEYRVIGNRQYTVSETSRDVLAALMQQYEERLSENTIRASLDFQKAQSWQEPVFFSHLIKSTAVQDIVDLSREMLFLNTQVAQQKSKKAA